MYADMSSISLDDNEAIFTESSKLYNRLLNKSPVLLDA